MRNAGQDESQAGLKISRRCIYNRRRQILPLSWQTAKELKSLLMKVEEEK